jgi:hypothetical protein
MSRQYPPAWLVWARYLSPTTYTYQLLMRIVLVPWQTYSCDTAPPRVPICASGAATFTGPDVLEAVVRLGAFFFVCVCACTRRRDAPALTAYARVPRT